MDIIARGMAAGLSEKIKDINYKIDNLSLGISWKGFVDYVKDLPDSAKIGDAYTVRYTGDSGTKINGAEYVFSKDENGDLIWVPFGPDLSELESEIQNIKDSMPYILDLT